MPLQKVILAFPIFKALHSIIITANIALCHDQEMWETANKYLIMGLISFETLFQTILLTTIYVVARGWGIVRFYILREEATYITIALGLVYLHYSAFFVTIELPLLNQIVKVTKASIIMFCLAPNRRAPFGLNSRINQVYKGALEVL